MHKPGWLTCWLVSPNTQSTGSTNSYRGTGDLFRRVPAKQPDLACHLTHLHHQLRAEKLGENEKWLWELSIDMFPEDGCLRVYGVAEDGVPAFTEYSIECLQQIIADERAAGRAPPKIKSTE
jgi:hypothetical protein